MRASETMTSDGGVSAVVFIDVVVMLAREKAAVIARANVR